MSTHTATENSSSSEVLTYSLHLTLLLFCASCSSTSLVSSLVSSLVMADSDSDSDYDGIDTLIKVMNEQGTATKEPSEKNIDRDHGETSKVSLTENKK